jgi:hypothetical protein
MISIDRRFCGPADSANGGYACGVAASVLGGDGPIEVTLRNPPPLATELRSEPTPQGALIMHGDQLVAEVTTTSLAIEPPPPVGFDEACRAVAGYPWATEHPFPQCFVCGPARAEGDGLRIFPGAVAGRNVAAAPWVPAASLPQEDGRVAAPIVWAALDCPSWFGAACFHPWEGRPLLGRLAVAIRERPRIGERCVCVGWLRERDGRKHHVGSAIYSETGELRAIARATWITVV